MATTARENAVFFHRKNDTCASVKIPLENLGYVMMVKAGEVRFDFRANSGPLSCGVFS